MGFLMKNQKNTSKSAKEKGGMQEELSFFHSNSIISYFSAWTVFTFYFKNGKLLKAIERSCVK